MANLEIVFAWVGDHPVPALVALGVLLAIIGGSRLRSSGAVRLDPQRMFDADQKRRIHARAGRRCEHKSMLWLRCPAAGNQADHIWPHSKGGATSLANAQSLCGPHNRSKSAAVPSKLYLARLERRRRKYFPSGELVAVSWQLAS